MDNKNALNLHIKNTLSQFLHLLKFSLARKQSFNKAHFMISIDVDVGSKSLYLKNKTKTPVHNFISEKELGWIEEKTIPILLDLFEQLQLPVTFALRGLLLDIESSIPEQILNCNVKHEIASHGYTHRVFTSLSENEVELELKKISRGMDKICVKPKSFIFPRNKVDHLPLLEKYGYVSFRGPGGFLSDEMNFKKVGNLYDLRPSFYMGTFNSPYLLKKLVDCVVIKKGVIHLWLHPWNLGTNPDSISKSVNNVFFPFLTHVKKLNDKGVLHFETMNSFTEKLIKYENIV